MELMWSWAGLGCIRLPLSKLSQDLYYILYVSLNGTTPRAPLAVLKIAFLGPNERFLYLCPRCHIQEHFLFVLSEMELVFISDRHSTAPHSTARPFLYLSSSREALSVLLLWLLIG